MNPIEIARKLAELGQTSDAQNAYELALNQPQLSPEEELEAACFIFYSQGDYRISFTHFVSLYNRGLFQAEILDLMTQAFYLPNLKELEKQYQSNIKALEKYPYLFRKDFLKPEELPILFFPFDDNGFVPFYTKENRFGDYVNFNDTIIDRWFFKDLSKPILAGDVYSQYQLEYLYDNVRKSEWVAKENHIYLHYTSWPTFCAYLQVLNFKKLLRDEKFVFLMEDQVSRYPIDFKAEYGIDYSQYDVKPIGVQEVKRLIWHTQLATHNGGDFFNEILYGHPNLLAFDSLMMEETVETVHQVRKAMMQKNQDAIDTKLYRKLMAVKNPSDKDILVALFLTTKGSSKADPSSRIVPALMFQPHFHNISYDVHGSKETRNCTLTSEQYEEIRRSPLFTGFAYIKTFTPLRRPTTSYGATIRFTWNSSLEREDSVVNDALTTRLLNRSFMVNPWDRLYRDSRLVRFEDGKLNPTATFTALAEFLDIPYTETMTYCSGAEGINPESLAGNDLGFSTAAIYRTYDDYCNDADRAFLEYFYRDVYEAYGYDFHYYKGEPVDEEWIRTHAEGAQHLDELIAKSYESSTLATFSEDTDEEIAKATAKEVAKDRVLSSKQNRVRIGTELEKGLRFVNAEGQPLQMMTPLKLDPALLEQPLYH